MPRTLTDADRAAWAAFVGRVAPIRQSSAAACSERVAAPSGRAPASLPQPARPARPALVEIGTHSPGLDKATWHRFRTGRVAAGRTLDLHGMTVQRAFHALSAFLHSAYAERLRCVEVVTGRGSGENSGAIRRELPLWLNLPEIRPLLLGAAHPHPANPGSVRLLLRRTR
jgi:DNA-nicking Smr family endonuclease